MNGGYVLAGYGVTVGALALYALRVLGRGRALSRAVAERPGAAGVSDGDRPSPSPESEPV